MASPLMETQISLGLVIAVAQYIIHVRKYFKITIIVDFPGGAVVKNPPASAGDKCSSPGPGRSHMTQSS